MSQKQGRTASKKSEGGTVRRPGRPPKLEATTRDGVTPLISRDAILNRAIQLAKVEPLSDLSIIGLAREFGVTPALIHYYAGSRDELISGVTNLYYQERVERLGTTTGDWRADIEHHARQNHALMVEYGGVLRYIMTHNRFRLFHKVGPGEIDYGLVYLDRIAQIFRNGGFSDEQAAMGYHLLAQYTMTAAYAEVSRQLPGDHGKFLRDRISAVSASDYPGAHFIAKSFAEVDSKSAFEAGLQLLLDGMEAWERKSNRSRAKRRSTG